MAWVHLKIGKRFGKASKVDGNKKPLSRSFVNKLTERSRVEHMLAFDSILSALNKLRTSDRLPKVVFLC